MTWQDIITGIGMVLVIEGLVYALAPSLVERLLETMRQMTLEQRRSLGLVALVSGIVVLWFVRG